MIRRVQWILCFIAALLIVGVVALRYFPSRGLQQKLDTIKAAGYPTTPSELDAWYTQVPEGENQAEAILAAIRSVVTLPKDEDPAHLGSVRAGQMLSPEMEEALAGYISTNQAALALLHKAAELKKSRYPINLSAGAAALLPHLAPVKSAASMLRFEAVYHSSTGSVDRAVTALTSGFAVARSLRNEPLLISELVRISCLAITIQGLERVLSEQHLSEAQLLELSNCLAQAEQHGRLAMSRAIAGERAGGLSVFNLSTRELQTLGPTPSNSDSTSAEFFQGLGMKAYRLTGFIYRDMSLYLDLMEGMTRATALEFPEAMRAAQKSQQEISTRLSTGLGRFAIFSRLLLPALSKAVGKEANITTRIRLAQLAIAVERYRLAHDDALPASLNDLTPQYLFKVPTDPYTGEALVFESVSKRGYWVRVPDADPADRGLGKNTEELDFKVLR